MKCCRLCATETMPMLRMITHSLFQKTLHMAPLSIYLRCPCIANKAGLAASHAIQMLLSCGICDLLAILPTALRVVPPGKCGDQVAYAPARKHLNGSICLIYTISQPQPFEKARPQARHCNLALNRSANACRAKPPTRQSEP